MEAIAHALEAPMAEPFGDAAADGDVQIVWTKDRIVTRDASYGVQALLPCDEGGAVALCVTEPRTDAASRDLVTPGGQEIAYVLEGAVDLIVADRMFRLSAGACASYEAALRHRLRRRGPVRAAVLVIHA